LHSFDRDELHHCAEQLAEDFVPPGWRHVASSSFTKVAENSELGLYYKAFMARSPAESLKARLRGSRAERAWRNGDALRCAGFDAPENVLLGKLGGGREYLYTRTARGRGVDAWLREVLSDRDAATLTQRRKLLRELGRFIGRMHASGFIHGDLRPGNVLASREHDRFRFTLIDNERNRRRRPPPGKALLRNLMQLNMLPEQTLGTTDRLRFLRAWREQMPELDRVEARVLGVEACRWALTRQNASPRG